MVDYKFYCFDGIPQFLYVSRGLENHETAFISFLTLDWQFAAFGRNDYKEFHELPRKPDNFEEMIRIARELSKGMKFLRVDLYSLGGKIYFSELTFSPCSGLMLFDPREWDGRVGEWISLDK